MTAAISLRLATLQDAEMLLAWRNDLQTRLSSHDNEPVPLPLHLAWLTALLNDKLRQLFVAEHNGIPVGSVRADLQADGIRVLSWTVAPDARGHGVGKRMLAALLEELQGPLRAEVKTGNIASMRIAEAAGLLLVREEKGVLHYVGTAGVSR